MSSARAAYGCVAADRLAPIRSTAGSRRSFGGNERGPLVTTASWHRGGRTRAGSPGLPDAGATGKDVADRVLETRGPDIRRIREVDLRLEGSRARGT